MIAFSTAGVNRATVGQRMPPDEVLEAYALSAAAYGVVFVLGALFGSFANVCIYRWPPTDEFPKGQSVVSPGSHCFACGKPVRWYDNIPIFSYFILRGRCRDCGARFSPRYMLVEAMLGLLWVALYHQVMVLAYPNQPLGARAGTFSIYAAFTFVMVVIAFIDLDHKLILDKITFPAIVLFYGLGLTLPGASWSDGLIGIAVGYGVVRAISDGYYFLTKREGMGYGDGKLLAVIGALAGWKAVLFSLFAGSLMGSVIGITVLVIARRNQPDQPDEAEPPDVPDSEGETDPDQPPLRHVELPFGPFLVMGAICYLFVYRWLAFNLGGLWGTSGP